MRGCDQALQPHAAHMHSRTPTHTHTVTLAHTRPQPSQTLFTCTHPHTHPRQQMGRSGNWLNLFRCLAPHWQRLSDRKAGWACSAKPAGLPAPPPARLPRSRGSGRGLWAQFGPLLARTVHEVGVPCVPWAAIPAPVRRSWCKPSAEMLRARAMLLRRLEGLILEVLRTSGCVKLIP